MPGNPLESVGFEPQPFEGEQRLARYLACAQIAYTHGITLRTAWEQYGRDGEIGAYWILLARRVWRESADNMYRTTVDSQASKLQ
jgi:hypothetical protein